MMLVYFKERSSGRQPRWLVAHLAAAPECVLIEDVSTWHIGLIDYLDVPALR